MVKTIKEMAEEHLKEKGYLLTTNNGVHMAEVAAIKMYEAGANAVLKEIEIVVTCNEDNTLNMARCLVDKIEELKEESV